MLLWRPHSRDIVGNMPFIQELLSLTIRKHFVCVFLSLLVLIAECGILLYLFLIIAYLFISLLFEKVLGYKVGVAQYANKYMVCLTVI